MRKPARRKCAHCREWFHPAREGQVVCSFDCASAIGKKQTAKAREAAKARAVKRQRESEKEGRQRRKARLAELRPNGYYKAQAQKAFNAYIRARDAGLPLIIEVMTEGKRVVVCHADYPHNEYAYDKPVDAEQVIWNRERVSAAQDGIVNEISGADLFIFGHTPAHQPSQYANQMYIDTGAVFCGRLTLVQIQGGDHA